MKVIINRKIRWIDGKEAGILRLLSRIFPPELFSPPEKGKAKTIVITTGQLFTAEIDGGGKPAIVSIDKSRFITRRLELPLAAGKHVQDAIAIELRRSMPRRGADLIWNCHLVQQYQGKLIYDVFITKSSVVEEVQNKAAEKNFGLLSISIEDQPNIMIWPTERGVDSVAKKWVLISAFFIASAVLILLVTLETRVAQSKQISEDLLKANMALSTEIDSLNAIAETDDDAKMTSIAQAFRSGERLAAKLNDISHIFKGESWISEFEYSPDFIRIAAFTDLDVTAIVQEIRKLEWVGDAQLNGPIIFDTYLKQNRFELTITEVRK
jgi:hypothetical protein